MLSIPKSRETIHIHFCKCKLFAKFNEYIHTRKIFKTKKSPTIVGENAKDFFVIKKHPKQTGCFYIYISRSAGELISARYGSSLNLSA